MIILCSRCREALPDHALELAGASLRGRCPGCQLTFERPLAAVAEPRQGEPPGPPTPGRDSASRPETASGPELGCPKCGQPAPPEAGDCRRCGLARARFDSFAAQSEAEVSPALRAAWAAVEEAWSDDGAHERFVEQAAAESAFAYAARCYRRAQRERPDRRAAAQLARIQRMAEVTFLTTVSARQQQAEPEPYRRVVAMLLALLALAGIAGLYALWKAQGSAADARLEPAVPAATQPAPAQDVPFSRPRPAPAQDAPPARR